MQDSQFKYTSHCLCIFYSKPFNFSAPTLNIIERKGSYKEFLFVQLFFKSDNIPQATFRGGDWVNNVTKNCCAYREIPSLLSELFLYSHIINGSLLSRKTKSSEKGIVEIWYFPKSRMDRQLWRFMINALIWNSAISGYCLLISALLNLIEEIFWNSRQIPESLPPEYLRQ